jgi:tetratricopeptide (TPR) repeat protein
MKKTLKARFFLSLLVVGLGTAAPTAGLLAQDSKIETGVVAFNGQDYKKAVEALKTGLANSAEVKPKNVPRGHYYLGMASYQLMAQVAQTAGGEQMAKAQEMSDLLDLSYNSMLKARETDAENKWTEKANKQLSLLNLAFLNGGLQAMNMTYGDKLTKEEKKEAYGEIIDYMKRCETIDASNYMVYDLRGQAQFALADSAKALEDFKTAIAKFEAKKPERPDQLIAYVYYRIAAIEKGKNKNLDAALKSIDGGKVALEKEHARVLAGKDKLKPEELTKLEEQFQDAQAALSGIELDILLNAPDKLQEALGKFEAAIAKDPKNYILYVAHAQLLEKVDVVKAEEVYKKATTIDPTKQLAWFNLGALYVNRGVEKYKEANKVEKNFDLAKSLQKEGDAFYRLAFPCLVKALEIEPCEGQALQGILNICINLSSDEAMAAEYTKYKKMQSDCQGK